MVKDEKDEHPTSNVQVSEDSDIEHRIKKNNFRHFQGMIQ